jgi:hypothetical protein
VSHDTASLVISLKIIEELGLEEDKRDIKDRNNKYREYGRDNVE